MAERGTRGGPFVDFYDFANRVDPVVLNKRTVDSLIKAELPSTPSAIPARGCAWSSSRSWSGPWPAAVSVSKAS